MFCFDNIILLCKTVSACFSPNLKDPRSFYLASTRLVGIEQVLQQHVVQAYPRARIGRKEARTEDDTDSDAHRRPGDDGVFRRAPERRRRLQRTRAGVRAAA